MKTFELRQIQSVLVKRNKKNFKKAMSVSQKKILLKDLNQAFLEGRLVYKITAKKLRYFYVFKNQFRGDFEEHFFAIEKCFCTESSEDRREFYKKIKVSFLEMKKKDKIKRAVVTVDESDEASIKYFSKMGELTSIDLVGETKKSLKILSAGSKLPKHTKITLLKKEEVTKLIRLDFASHMADKTSRMRSIFVKKNAFNNAKKFYARMLKNKACFVIRVEGKPAGNIGFFVDKKNKRGLIACIFVANDFKGRGLSKFLYRKLLEEFSKRKLTQYIGSTTTTGVLAVARSIGRRPFERVFLTTF